MSAEDLSPEDIRPEDMSPEDMSPEGKAPLAARDAAFWAARPDLAYVDAPTGAVNLNVTGKRVTGPVQGFGQMWQKTYSTALPASCASPQELIALWKQEYGSFWPRGSRFYGSQAGIKPGESALLNIGLGDATLVSTGILVLYADDESFTFATPEGHSFAGWITFSAASEADRTVAKIDVLFRASDPLYELATVLGLQRMEDLQWQRTLRALGRRVGCDDAVIVKRRVCVDRRRQWDRAGNVRQNSAVRTVLYRLTHPRPRRAPVAGGDG